MKSNLKAFVEIIAKNVDALNAALEARGMSAPCLDEPFEPGSDVTNGDPELMRMADITCRAAMQLVHLIRPPQLSVIQNCTAHLTSALMRCALELHIAEILREAGPEGLHVDTIAEKCGVETTKIGTILRGLTSGWVFKEVVPDVFANNRLSSLLDTGKSIDELKKHPETTFDEPQAATIALMSFLADDSLKSSAFLYEAMSGKKRGFSGEANDSAFSVALGTKKSYWGFIHQPDQKARVKRFAIAMEGTRRVEPPGLAVQSFPWASLADGATVVDVGGGLGAVSFKISEAFPKLRFIVQDARENIEEGRKCYQEAVSRGQMVFEEHDFLTPNPAKNADVFMLRYILHDWSDLYAKQILKHLRDAAGPDTRLISTDIIVPHFCSIPEDHINMKIPGVLQTSLPSPLSLANVSLPAVKNSALMLGLFNGQERTLRQTVDIFESAGWRVESVVQFDDRGTLPSTVCAVPIH